MRRQLLIALPVVLGCGQADSNGNAAPARVENPTTEAALTTVRITERASERIGIEVAPIERRALTQRRTLGGELMAPPGSSVIVSAPRAATILAADSAGVPAAGSRVVRGQPLVRLVVLPDGGGLSRVQEELAGAEARYDNAQAKADRAQRLLREGVASAAEYEDAKAELASAEAVVRAARARFELLQQGSRHADADGLPSITLRAPEAGIVLGVRVAVGQTVSDGAPLMEIVRPSPLWVRVPMYVGDLTAIDRSAPVTVVAPGDPAATPGQRAVPIQGPPTADLASSSADLYYRLDNSAGRFRPGERVGVSVPLLGAAEELAVPWSAILHDINGGTWLYEALPEYVFVRRRVEVKDVIDGFAALRRGP
ncbi:MAG: efflux RND transporter periplasmic adaptor subunit, partial [Gemmatimonadota bacterium]|nr:efflux RND transporter periplasmic adaptor subunit [Gemmatimonadota bacterium]